MKTTLSPNPMVAADPSSVAELRRVAPVWCSAFRLSSAGEHAQACTPNTLRRSTLHALTLLCAAALLTHAAYAAKPPPPPPPPPPTSGTLVLDYLGQEGCCAEGFGLTVAPSGSIYASGISDSPSHGVVLASSDGGNSWSLADVFAPPGRYAYWENFFGGITSDAAGNLYVSGLTYSEDGIQPDQWYVRRSTDGGTTWTTVDDFDPGSPPNTTGDVRGITVDADGDVYVSGHSYDAALNVRPWTIRKGVGGISFSTVDTVPNAYPCAVFAHPTAGIFAVGRRSIVIRNKSSDAWTVRRSTNGGATWSNVDTFQLASGESAIAVGIGADVDGDLYVVGSGNTRSGGYYSHWVVRKSTDGGNSWNPVDEFQQGGSSASARCFGATPNGDLYVGGIVKTSTGTHWIVRKNPGGAGAWTTIDDYQYAPSVYTEPHSMAADASGNLFVGGTGGGHWLIKKY